MREKRRRQEGDLITVGSKGIKTEIRETYVIARRAHINTDRAEVCNNKLKWRSVCRVLQLRCLFNL